MPRPVPRDNDLIRVDLLRIARLRKGLTMMEVGRRAEVTTDTVKRAESGRATPKTYVKLAEVLGIELEELIPSPASEELVETR